MAITYSYILIGDPIPLSRPRFGGRRVYDPQKRIKDETIFKLLPQVRHGILAIPLTLEAIFYCKIPKNKKIPENSPRYCRPDLDNYIKFLLDVGNGTLFKDDALITHIDAQKRYSKTPRTEFSLRESENG